MLCAQITIFFLLSKLEPLGNKTSLQDFSVSTGLKCPSKVGEKSTCLCKSWLEKLLFKLSLDYKCCGFFV